MERSYIDLYTLQARVKTGMEALFPDRIWVKAEIAGLSRKPNGHCYLELSQSGPGGLVAKSRAVIWASRIGYVDTYFKSVTGASLDVGMEILARVQVSYHVLYGLTLTIDEVDPEFTMGEKELQKKRTLERLSREGLLVSGTTASMMPGCTKACECDAPASRDRVTAAGAGASTSR